jgi:mono/diheme cytochrome c family protein
VNVNVRRASLILLAISHIGCRNAASDSGTQQPKRHYGLGTPATATDIAAQDIDVGPDGAGLPPGHGTPNEGQAIYAQQCASCHGARGEGKLPFYPRLVGRDSVAEGFQFGKDPRLPKTIGNYWPYATTVFDYIRRAMPLNAPGSLNNDQVYALTAYLLSANRIITPETTLDSANLASVRMPYVERFVKDDRRGGPEVR